MMIRIAALVFMIVAPAMADESGTWVVVDRNGKVLSSGLSEHDCATMESIMAYRTANIVADGQKPLLERPLHCEQRKTP